MYFHKQRFFPQLRPLTLEQKDFECVFHCEWNYVYPMDDRQLEAHCAYWAQKGVKWQGLHEDWTINTELWLGLG